MPYQQIAPLSDHLTEIEKLARQLDAYKPALLPLNLRVQPMKEYMLLESLKVGILESLRKYTQELTMSLEDDDV